MDEQEEPNDTEEKCEGWPMQELKGMMGGRSLDKQGNSKEYTYIRKSRKARQIVTINCHSNSNYDTVMIMTSTVVTGQWRTV